MAINKTGELLVTGGADNSIRIINNFSEMFKKFSKETDQTNFELDPIILEGHSSSIISLTIDNESILIFSGSKDKTIKVWN